MLFRMTYGEVTLSPDSDLIITSTKSSFCTYWDKFPLNKESGLRLNVIGLDHNENPSLFGRVTAERETLDPKQRCTFFLIIA
ncbi:hypothetical protein VNO77_20282 [Canavalia gladiata]|uniref:Uncharacterized protein n=1 Tax=Canavalia gladiata TaxID=3824 RepID=A0AAN9QL57_CANGL